MHQMKFKVLSFIVVTIINIEIAKTNPSFFIFLFQYITYSYSYIDMQFSLQFFFLSRFFLLLE